MLVEEKKKQQKKLDNFTTLFKCTYCRTRNETDIEGDTIDLDKDIWKQRQENANSLSQAGCCCCIFFFFNFDQNAKYFRLITSVYLSETCKYFHVVYK